ncbi:MAG: DEAD/DEAH box helicase [Spirochaetota bacterium]
MESQLEELEKARGLAKKRAARNIIAQAKTHSNRLKSHLAIDSQLREHARNRLGENPQLINTELRDNKGLGIKTNWAEKAGPLEKEESRAAEKLDFRNKLIEESLQNTEYTTPEGIDNKIDELKTIIEYEKVQEKLSGEKKNIENIDTENLSISELKSELEQSKFGDGIYVDAKDLDKEIEKQVIRDQTERQAALNSTLHDTFTGEGINSKKWVANGAYNALNTAILDIWNEDALDRDIVDILGASNASQILASQVKEKHGDTKKIVEALEKYHTDTNEGIAQKGLEEGRKLLDKAEELDALIKANKENPGILKDLVEDRQSLVDRASAKMGGALGATEAIAALSFALKNKDSENITANLGKISEESAMQQVKVLGLDPSNVNIEKVGGEQLLSIGKEQWQNITGSIDKQEIATREKIAAIKLGAEDEDGWLPKGIIRRPFESFVAPEASQTAEGNLQTQTLENDDNLKEAMHRSLGLVPEASFAYKTTEDLTPQEQTALRRYWERNIYSGSTADLSNAREMQQQMRAEHGGAVNASSVWNKFVNESGTEGGAFDKIREDLIDNHSSTDMFGDKEVCELALADTNNIDSLKTLPENRKVMEKIASLEEGIALGNSYGENTEALQKELSEHTKGLDDTLKENYKNAMQKHFHDNMSGYTKTQYELGTERELKTAWGEYVRVHGNVKSAQESVQDAIKGEFQKNFRDNYAQTSKQWLHQDIQEIRNRDKHVIGTIDEETRSRYLSKAQRELQSKRAHIMNRDSNNRFAKTSAEELAHAARLLKEDKEKAEGASLFDSQELNALQYEKTHYTTLGKNVESQLASIIGEASGQFQHGKQVKVFAGLDMSKSHAIQQRAIKMLDTGKKMQLSFGTGSGKSLAGIGSFTHLHGKGKVNRAIYAVPSAVQEQFGSEMQKYTEVGKYKWESRAGLSRTERIAALKDPKNHMNVVTHQSLRDDILHLISEHDKTGPELTRIRFNAMDEKQRSEHLGTVLKANGIDHNMLVFDESHYGLDREGKPDSTLTNIVNALGHNSEYLLRQSATPIKNDLSEAYHMLHSLAPDKYDSFNDFKNRYGLDTQASKRALQKELDRYNYASPSETGVKRNSATESVELSPKQAEEYQKVQDAAQKVSLAVGRGKADIEALKVLAPRSFDGLDKKKQEEVAKELSKAVGTLRTSAENRVVNQFKAEDNAKIQKLSEIIEKKAQSSGSGDSPQGVVFAHNRESLTQIERYLKEQGYRVGVLHGGHTGKEKEQIKNDFFPQTGKPKHDILVMSDAGATGMNLQNAKYLVNYDLPDTSWVKEQREGRIDRHGQVNTEIDYHDLVSNTGHDKNKQERIKRKAELGTIFQQDPNTLDDRGILAYLQGAEQEKFNSGTARDLFAEDLFTEVQKSLNKSGL